MSTELKDKIIHESLRLFSLKGFLGTSTHDILTAANTSKGGMYNHFKAKEDLIPSVLEEARRHWRTHNLAGLDKIDSPLGKVKRLLENYGFRYLKDKKNLPGGCVFITLSVELDDQRPDLCREVLKGWAGFKSMINRLLDEAIEIGEIAEGVDTQEVTQMILAGMLGTSLLYGVEKSGASVNHSINSLIKYLDSLAP